MNTPTMTSPVPPPPPPPLIAPPPENDDVTVASTCTCIDDIRRGVVKLATSDKLDKESALHVTRLFHGMEMLMRHECTERDKKIAEANNDLERLRIQVELDRISNRSLRDDTAVAATPTAARARSKGKW